MLLFVYVVVHCKPIHMRPETTLYNVTNEISMMVKAENSAITGKTGGIKGAVIRENEGGKG